MIGVFDSGLGGLTVARALMKTLPGYDILYFGDTARMPYGTKSLSTVAGYAAQSAELLLERGARLLVIACNTASSIDGAADIAGGRVPVFDVITPAVASAAALTRGNAVGIIGTRSTIASGVYERRLHALRPDIRVETAACPLLVPLVEEGWIDTTITTMTVKKYLHPLRTRQIDTLILGCTHYPVLKRTIQRKIGKRVQIVDSSECIADDLQRFLASRPEIDRALARNDDVRVLVSDRTDATAGLAERILGRAVLPEFVQPG